MTVMNHLSLSLVITKLNNPFLSGIFWPSAVRENVEFLNLTRCYVNEKQSTPELSEETALASRFSLCERTERYQGIAPTKKS
jgi:hypothetical protein